MTRIRTSLKSRYEIVSRRRRQTYLRKRHRADLPPLDGFDQGIVDALERDGAAITSLAELAADGVSSQFDMKAALELLSDPQQAIDFPKDYLREASSQQLASAPQLIKWGLEERFLAIVENYIGLPIAYRGLVMRRDFADGSCRETRQWHRDAEDMRIVKIIVYVNDVGEDGGAFRFIPKAQAPRKGIENVNGRVPLDHMRRLIGEDRYVKCSGPAGTVLFADPVNIWHHGSVPESADRLSAFYAYNSQYPLRPDDCHPLVAMRYLGDDILSPRQAAAIDYGYPVTEPGENEAVA